MVVIVNKKKFVRFIAIILLVVALLSVNSVLRLIYPLEYENEIVKYSQEFGLDKHLVMGIISAESGFDESAVSSKNAVGLMQIKEETAQWCVERLDIKEDVTNLADADANIHIGCAYLDYLVGLFENEETAVAAYNAGLGNVRKWLENAEYSEDGKILSKIPFVETEKYVDRVFSRKKTYKKLYE